MELCRRHSNRPERVDQLVDLFDKITIGVPDTDGDLVSVHGIDPAPHRISDRLSSTDVQELVELYRTGSTIKVLAEKYSVSTTTIKRLVREHGVRKRGPRDETLHVLPSPVPLRR